jgi:nuclear pore complex protein Nup155
MFYLNLVKIIFHFFKTSTNDKHIFQPIVHIAALNKIDSTNINLVAMTHYGIRLYFTLNPFDRSNDPPSTFQLVHVRLAPNIDLNAHSNMGPIISAFYKNGLTIMINKRDDQVDSVLLLSNDLYVLHNQFKESKAIFDIDGRTWQIDEIPSRDRITDDDSYKLSSQLFDSQRRFAMITPQGCFIWNKLRPIDQFYFALIESNGPNSDLVRLFFNRIYARSEACALCLAVALVRLSTDVRVTDWATKAFFVYGGDAEIRKRSALSSIQNLGYQQSQVQTQAPVDANETLIGNRLYPQLPQSEIKPNINRANFSFSQLHSPKVASTPMHHRTKDYTSTSILSPGPKSFISPSIQQQQQQQPFMSATNVLQASDINSEFELVFSGKHDALYIYVSRLLAPIWNKKLLYEIQAGNDQITFASFTQIDIDFYLTKLNALKSFLEFNHVFLQPQNLQNYLYQSEKLMNELFGVSSANLGTMLLQWNTNKVSLKFLSVLMSN